MYENSSDYSSVLNETKTSQDYAFDWSVLIDANLEFFNPEVKKKSHIHCVFSRVYIDDMDLLRQGNDDGEFVADESESKEDLSEEQIQEVSTNMQKDKEAALGFVPIWNCPPLHSAPDEDVVKKEKLQDEIDCSNAENVKNKAPTKKQKFCKDFEKNVRSFGFATGFDLSGETFYKKKVNGSEDGSESSKFSAGILDYAQFWQNEDCKRFSGCEGKKRKKAKARTSSSLSATTSSLQISGTASKVESNTSLIEGSEDSLSINISMEKLNFEDKLNFDFSFDPKRDRKLVAKRARKYFSDDKEMMKYWFQRYRYFTKLDEGILLDREAWFSVTPEMLAQHVADRLVRIRDCIILDAFAGSGGNSIQFALKGAFVYAIDLDPVKLRCSARNAQIYGARDRINFICGNFFHICKSLIGARKYKEENKIVKSSYPYTTDLYPFAIDAVYLSPPWGGPSYAKSGKEEFDLQKDITLDGVKIFNYAKKISQNVVYFLPKNTSVDQIIALAASDGEVELEQSFLGERVKALHAYYGKLVAHD
uniref:Trimethylguanosine synthase n=1 Tax=Meloidogyne incognita TaxID=6306 RepID=A0A914MWE6_MELIC